MALYDLEIIEHTSNPKALSLIGSLSGLSSEEVKRRLNHLPMMVQSNVLLSDAVAAERQLSRLGVNTRLVRLEIGMEDSDSRQDFAPVHQQDLEEIIEIPAEQVRTFQTFRSHDRNPKLKRKRISHRSVGKKLITIAVVLSGILLASLYLVQISRVRQNEEEISRSIGQWRKMLEQQDLMLDAGMAPEEISNRLNEIENDINRLIAMVKSPQKSAVFKAKFDQIRQDGLSRLRDLEFRKRLVESDFPIHPTCLVDRDVVSGYSDLPDGSVVRIMLLGRSPAESPNFAARIEGGVFRMKIDPAIGQDIYDAKATIAPFSQQPEGIQRWASAKFSLQEDAANRDSSYTTETASADFRMIPATRSDLVHSLEDHQGGLEPADSLPVAATESAMDSGRIFELKQALATWTETMQDYSPAEDLHHLEELYQRLTGLEARIDRLVEILEAPLERNIWIERREDTYGSHISERNEIEKMHEEFLNRGNPLYQEAAIQKILRDRGFPDSQVLLIDSPRQTRAFVVDIEVYQGNQDSLLAVMAQSLSDQLEGSSLDIERIKLRYQGTALWWSVDDIREAAAALEQPDGLRRCAFMLELRGSSLGAP